MKESGLVLALKTAVLFTSEEHRRRPQHQSPVPGHLSPVQQSPAAGCLCFRNRTDPTAAVVAGTESIAKGNASEPKSRGNGSRIVFITAAATILGTKTEADITSGGGRLFHEPRWAVGCSQLSQSSLRSLLTNSNEPIGILHCGVLPLVQGTPRLFLGMDHSEAQTLGEHTSREEAGSARNTMVEKADTSEENLPLCLSS